MEKMKTKQSLRRLKSKVQNVLFRNGFIYRKYLGNNPDLNTNYLADIKSNTVLKSNDEITDYTDRVKKLGLPISSDNSKNWDTLIAYSEITKKTSKESVVLDAGAEIYSRMLPWLFLSGYKKLFGINIVFSKDFKRGAIHYSYGDITNSKFPPNHFDAVTCLSVIEHGVDTEKFLRETNRILKPGGKLILSTDYYETPIDTTGKYAYGHQVKVFDKKDMENMIDLARRNNLFITSEIDLSCNDKPVHWERFDLRFTFICLSFEKAV
jgi:SAM-dependent methyltransferase